jgi:signal transduction histidine kinase
LEVETAIVELRELVRGLNPPEVTRYGLAGALAAVAGRSPVPVLVHDRTGGVDVPEPVAVAAFYVALEAIANAQKHSAARTVQVSLASGEAAGEDRLLLTVCDDGRGGARLVSGGGLRGLQDRVESCGGRLRVDSRRGGGTTVLVSLPMGGAG